ncbi:hypothetical protein Scep_020821 [Stephania cephalantha]|uniref:Heparan-alpha-glucosaminide N-acetyltransferase catalytic domain-containing protein n=1 Tax=Stephania cephalantha TaxID=152367 RepID=A0AAP0HZP1_9MAGN
MPLASVGGHHMGAHYELVKGEEKDPHSNEMDSHSHVISITQCNPPLTDASKPRRLLSLDVFRGLTVALMIFVDDIGGLIPAINHSPWDGVTLADFVMPFFLFIVGVSLGLTYKKLACSLVATRKAVLRALKLFILGVVLQGGYFHGLNDLTYGIDIQRLRLMGTLQRIAIAYLIVALCEIWLKRDDAITSKLSSLKKYQCQWVLAFVLTAIYMALLYALYVPDWDYQISSVGFSGPNAFSVKCGVRGDTSPGCNSVGMVDRKILGIQHLYMRPGYRRTKQCSIDSPDNGSLPPDAPSWCQAPFDPEGILSSVMAIVTCLIGLHYGHIIVHFKDHKDRILHWAIPATSLAFMGFSLDLLGLHVNKNLYSLSYTCLTAGVAGLLFAGVYILVDVCGCKRPTLFLEWMGKHALMLYILAACNILPMFLHGFYWQKPQNNILSLIGIRS